MTKDEQSKLQQLLRIQKLEQAQAAIPVLMEMAEDVEDPIGLYDREVATWLNSANDYCQHALAFIRKNKLN